MQGGRERAEEAALHKERLARHAEAARSLDQHEQKVRELEASPREAELDRDEQRNWIDSVHCHDEDGRNSQRALRAARGVDRLPHWMPTLVPPLEPLSVLSGVCRASDTTPGVAGQACPRE